MLNVSPDAAKDTQRPIPQYSVYGYHKNQYQRCLPRWKKLSATHNMKRALKHARLLNTKKEYERVEVKKCFFCDHEKRVVGKTIRIYEPSDFSWVDLMKTFSTHAK